MSPSALGSPLTAPSAYYFTPRQPTTSFYPPRLLPLRNRRLFAYSSSSYSYNPPPSPAISDQAVLDAVSKFDGSENTLPAVRIFENDLARLTLVGAVDFQQALTAAAADGGDAADEHLLSGMEAMVVETVFPGSGDDHSTISTRLFLPARKVKEKAMNLRKSLTREILSGTTSRNILAMTFRQVVLQKLWSLELVIFSPGTERNMNDLENPREVSMVLMLTSSDETILSDIAEVVSNAALESTKRLFLRNSMSRKLKGFLSSLFKKRKGISTRDSSVRLDDFLENEVLASAGTLLEKFKIESGKGKFRGTKWKNLWWSSPAFLELERIGGPEFCAWISESLPCYMLTIDGTKFSELKLDGWEKSVANKWEGFLVCSQMVSLADILDMYYEDVFTLPNKKLVCNAVANSSRIASRKGNPLFNAFSSAVVAAIFLVSITVLKKLYLPHLPLRSNYIRDTSSSDVSSIPLCSVGSSQLEELCIKIISRIKDYNGWHGEIHTHPSGYAWIGELPPFLRALDNTASDINDSLSTSVPFGATDEERRVLEDIATYQVVLSGEGNVVGFQPTSRVAVNNWASNPLAKDLYGGKDLSPGLLEPGLTIRPPNGVVVLELLMSLNPNFYFSLVRLAADLTGER